MTDLPQKTWFRVAEVAYYFDVDDSTIRRWIDHGKLEASKVGGSIRISRRSISEFQEASRINALE